MTECMMMSLAFSWDGVMRGEEGGGKGREEGGGDQDGRGRGLTAAAAAAAAAGSCGDDGRRRELWGRV